ncbi:hypothetical protein L1987_64958 [Smallanthus sonchifolius]|uniref:Uncharacterized protein n=1 Tax=Smallanthus sonchifolius TaxID=185202 RepID=A0ACB9BT51_9ASTR|nr:hypothetical protein L1987_64958 [Smallanthus sonchifolius]
MIFGYTRTRTLELGKWIHFYAEKNGFLQKTSLCNALIEMYAHSGNIDQALQVFDNMLERDSKMMCGLANHGKAPEAIHLFQETQKTTTKPNEITFVVVTGIDTSGLAMMKELKKMLERRSLQHVLWTPSKVTTRIGKEINNENFSTIWFTNLIFQRSFKSG